VPSKYRSWPLEVGHRVFGIIERLCGECLRERKVLGLEKKKM
jgi:hypothetical protein